MESSVSLAHLADDLSTGAWERKHGQVLKHEDLDLGYRLVIATMPSNKPLQRTIPPQRNRGNINEPFVRWARR